MTLEVQQVFVLYFSRFGAGKSHIRTIGGDGMGMNACCPTACLVKESFSEVEINHLDLFVSLHLAVLK